MIIDYLIICGSRQAAKVASMTKNNRAVLSVNAAVLLFGAAGLFVRWISLSAVAVTFGRVAFSSV
jgi:hypothetical protein